MYRKLGVVSLAMLSLSALVVGQTEPAAPAPTTQPAMPRTPQEMVALVELQLESARAANRDGRTGEARAMLVDAQRGVQLVLNAEPKNTQARVLAGEILAEAGSHDDSRTIFKAVLEDDPSNFRANLGLGRYYVIARLWRQAEAYLLTASRVVPMDRRSEVLRLLAVCYSNQTKRDKAIEAAKQATAAAPEDIDSLQLLVRVLIDAQQYEPAIEAARSLAATAQQACAARPAERTALVHLSQAYEAQAQALNLYYGGLHQRNARNEPTDQLLPGREAEAARVLVQVARISQELSRLRVELGYHESLMFVEQAVTYQPNNTGYRLDLANLLEATHQAERAIENYQRLLEITNPTDADPAQARKNMEAAREALQRLNAPLTSRPADSSAAPQP